MKKTLTPRLGKFNLKVKKSKTGKGLFALQNIARNALIIEYVGVNVSEEDQYKIKAKYLFETDKNKTINGNIKENTARYINHSCKPNCEARGPKGRVYIYSTKKIKAGDELTYDYGKEYFDEHIKPKGCLCIKCKN